MRVDIKITDTDGKSCVSGEAGDICVRHAFSDRVKYENAPEKTEQLRRNGFIVTGDIGYLDAEQYLFISDRHSDLVISGGVNI